MSSLGIALVDCCKYLVSSKKTERRKRLEELKLLLENSNAVEYLNRNSEHDRSTSWFDVFQSLHSCLLWEQGCYCEEITKGKLLPATDKNVKACCGLLVLVLTTANSGHPRLPCKTLFECILELYERAESNEVILNSVIGETYISLLGLALSSEKYWEDISFQIWKEIGQLSLGLLKSRSSEKMRATIISILNIMLLEGGRLYPLIIKSKNLLDMLPEILKFIETSKYHLVELSYLRITHTICTQFGKEFRLSVSSFIDKMLPYILTFNNNRISDTEFKEIIADVLLEMVSIRLLDKGWIQEASSVLSFVENELNDICRHKVVLPPLPKMVILAVKLAKHLHGVTNEIEDSEDPIAKRRKVSSCIGNILDNATSLNSSPWAWLCYLDYLLETAPELVLDEDFQLLFQYYSDVLPQSSDPLALQYITRSSVRLLNLCKERKKSCHEKCLQDLQNILWIGVLRFVITPSLADIGLLLAAHLIPDWAPPESAKALLDLFINKNIPVTKNSLSAVFHLTSAGFISSSEERISLASWCLSGEYYSADAVFSLLLKTRLPIPQKQYHSKPSLTDTELFYFLTSFGVLPSLEANSSGDDISPTVFIEDKIACNAFPSILVERLSSVNALNSLLPFTASMCTLLSYSIKHSISIKDRIKEILNRTLPGILSQLEDALQTSGRSNNKPLIAVAGDFFEQLSKLGKRELSDEILNIFNILMDLLKEQHKNSLRSTEKPSLIKIIGADSQGVKETPEIVTVNALFSLIEVLSENGKIQAFISLINLCTNNLTLTSQSGFNIAASVIKRIVTAQDITLVLMKDLISLELKLCKRWLLQYTATTQMIDVIDATIKPLFRCDQKGEIKSQIYLMISLFCKQIESKKYGSQIILKFLSLLAHTIQADPLVQHTLDTRNGKRSMLLYFVDFLSSPFHEVRVRTAEFLPKLFGAEMCLHNRPDQVEAFNKAIKAVDNLFIVKEGKSPDEVKEEGINRSFCALKILSGLICSCNIWRRKSLYYLFKIISSKNINQTLFLKVHHYLEQSLKIDSILSFLEQNLDYVLWCWYEEFNTFEKFPYHFMNYESLPAFLNEYKTIILPIFLENLDMECYLSFCKTVSVSKSDAAVSCLPELIACLVPKLGGTDLKLAEKLNSFILQLVDHTTMKSQVTSEIRKILLAIFMKLNDVEHFTRLCGSSGLQLPTALPLNILCDGVNASLEYLQRTIPKPQSLLVFLCNDHPHHIQFIMHNLLANVSIATTTEIRSLCFLQYITLCDAIASDLSSIKKMAGFVIWHTIHALLNLMQTDLTLLANIFLYRFLKRCFPNQAKYVDYSLDDLFSYLLPITSEDSETGNAANKIKEFLISKKEFLPKIVSYLPLEETTADLAEELKFFLQRQSPDLTSLDRLSSQLIVRKEELILLYDQVKNSKCFSDDCSKSLVHQLISKLVTLATSADSKIQTSAARCLGQIGPRNLSTLVLQPENATTPPPLAEKVLLLLLPLLIHNDSELCEAASNAVSELLCTNEGLAAYEQLNGVEKVLFKPFLPSNRGELKKIPYDISVDKLSWGACFRVVGSTSPGGWAVWSGGDHSTWIKSVVSRLLAVFNQGLLPLLAPIAAKQVGISEELLPYVVDIIMNLSDKYPEGLKIVQSNLAYFFKKHFELRSNAEKCEDESSVHINRKSVQCMINVVNFCRLKTVEMPERERMDNLNQLNISFLHVAYAAQFCRAYFTSLLYVELWVESVKSDLYNSASSNMIPLDLVCKKFPDDGQVLLNLLWEDYKELGERDSIEGCVRLLLGDPKSRLRYFREMGLWSQLIAEADIANDKEALSQGLLMSGLFTCASVSSNCSWEAAWRLACWDIEQPAPGHEEFSSVHYSAIRSALYLKDKENAVSLLNSARDLVIRDLSDASLEVAASVYLPLTKLQLITELESWCYGEDIPEEVPDSEWIHTEPILWQRGLLLAQPQHWLLSARVARSNSSHLVALKLLQHTNEINMNQDLLDETKVEQAQIHWDSGNLETAKYILRSLLDSVEDPFLKAKCLLTYGTWMSESKFEGPKAIIDQYFQEAASLLKSRDEQRLAAAECLAKFADSEYQRIHRYLKSPEYEMKKTQMDELKKNIEVFKSCPFEQQTYDEKKTFKIHQCNIEVDEAEMEAIHQEYSSFLRLAVKEYLYSLQFEKTTGDRMFRFVSLWLSNNQHSGLRQEVDRLLDHVPSYRFIPVFPQLTVRITSDSDHFASSLKKLLYRCCEDHPYHCLWHILALANAEADQIQDSPPQPRVTAAARLIHELSKSKSAGRIVEAMQELAIAYISLANLQLPKNARPGEQKIPKTERLRQIKDISFIPCATMNIPINKKADYSKLIGIIGFEEIYTLVGGINAPKKVKCLCSDGKKRDELVKGQDDPRQDALMQQVFSVLNNLLEGDKNTARRKLSVRTYKVVPLTQKSGVIEWCSNTEPVGAYLRIAHAKHRPQDPTLNQCRAKLEVVAGRSPEEKLKMYLKICSQFKPVMRHFFFEKYPNPGVWYERRLTYTRSVATNSMIGYVMGIGDRHLLNILIDLETAELVHIDFGIAFELAKILPTPETVPFRLTRDIEDGMGITSFEGVFRRCCEETMRLLRKRSEPIMTTLEMLLYDPIYSWSVKPRKSDQSQQALPNMSAAETNKLAERFLQRLKLKLEGREEGGSTSVEAQVRNLIQEARDPKNLCRLFRGWQAYL